MAKPTKKLAGLERLAAKAKSNTESIQRSEQRRSPSEFLPLESIRPSPFQARKEFGGLEELAADIREHGVLQPVLVRPREGGYELVAGERRWRASKLAQTGIIPAVVRIMSDQEARIFGLSENLRRENLNAYELARAATELAAALGSLDPGEVQRQMTHGRAPGPEVGAAMEQALAVMDRQLSLSSFRRHYAPLLKLPEALVEAIQAGASYAAVGALSRATAAQQRRWLPQVMSGEWGVRDVQAALRQARAPAQTTPTDPEQTAQHIVQHLAAGRWQTLNTRQQRRAGQLLRELADLLAEN